VVPKLAFADEKTRSKRDGRLLELVANMLENVMQTRVIRAKGMARASLAALAVSAAVAACGGADKDGATAVPTPQAIRPDDAGAVRFLAQASFGANTASIAEVKSIGLENWVDRQMSMSRDTTGTHLAYVTSQIPLPVPQGTTVTADPAYHSFWRQAIAGPDQLRQRVAFALSQILVTSTMDPALAREAHGMASYYDLFADNAFGNYRDLLGQVSIHPAMGLYLTAMANRGDGTRIPDENYAREVMQLFTIGLYELNMDGTVKTVNGAAVETYDMDDIRGLAKVFTGWSWGNEGAPSLTANRFFGRERDPRRSVMQMQFYPAYHSAEAKQFLNVNIPAGTDGKQALNTALDALVNHPNTPPFVARQLIQRLVTSNPSPAYVERVATAFATGKFGGSGSVYSTGSGRRGDLRATVAAILLDPEARDASVARSEASASCVSRCCGCPRCCVWARPRRRAATSASV
jgi:uncharacterized protein (DUF1800 family)